MILLEEPKGDLRNNPFEFPERGLIKLVHFSCDICWRFELWAASGLQDLLEERDPAVQAPRLHQHGADIHLKLSYHLLLPGWQYKISWNIAA